MSPRILAVIVAIILVIALGTALIVKRSKPGYRPGDPNAPPKQQRGDSGDGAFFAQARDRVCGIAELA